MYFCDGKRSIFCCGNCVWFDDKKKQDCVNSKVNVMVYMCTGTSRVAKKSPKLLMLAMEKILDKQLENSFAEEESMKVCVRYGCRLALSVRNGCLVKKSM